MDSLEQLSPAHCVLLATHYAAESNVDDLRTLSLARSDAFDPATLLRILLTFLPESTDPSTYNTYAQEVASRLYLQQRAKPEVDTTPVKDLSSSKAQKRVSKLDLLPLAHSSCAHDNLDLLTLFLIHRAYRIDGETGLLALIPQLVDPFLDHTEYLRTWFISNVLPLLRLDFEYYANDGSITSLEKFGGLYGPQGVEILVAKAKTAKDDPPADGSNIARDLKGIVGPWMYGADQRKRRKAHGIARRRASVGVSAVEQAHQGEDAVPAAAQDNHDWEYVYAWMVRTAPQRFDLVSDAVEYWDGPGDVDLGGYEDPSRQDGLDEEVQSNLEKRYAQAAFASVYSADSNTRETIEAAHGILVRLASIMEFIPPPDLATSVEMLPKIEGHTSILQQSSSSILQPDTLLNPNHPLTTPTVETFSLLQIFVYSAYILADLGHPISLNNLAKFRFHSDEDGQLQMVNKILKGFISEPKMDEDLWASARRKLIWLWNWGIDAAEKYAFNGPGVFGKIGRFSLEKAILISLLETGQSQLAVHIFLPDDGRRDHLQDPDIEECVLNQVMQHYDNASNGNVTRGGMKKALELLAAFQPWFSDSPAILSTEALLAATHSLSFYSLTLQHGVPFRPVNIRISDDSVSLIAKVLDQNPRSYSKLDDLINIGQNLVAARTLERIGLMIEVSSHEMEEQKELASRRVTGMAIEAALAEDDFETAYSFVVNRLNPVFNPTASSKNSSGRSSPQSTNTRSASECQKDDISWRAAFLAGRHRSPSGSLSSSHASVAGSPALRRLDQRMELLSQALLLAPSSAVPEVLTAWRRCEEEMTALLAQETEEEERFNDHADRRAPGAFPTQAKYIQPRREVGRGATQEAPMGLFDVARGAAAAFSKTAFPLRAGPSAAASAGQESGRSSLDASRNFSVAGSDVGSGDEGRVRKRDMVANAVTGGLASGIGWMIGATPVAENQRREDK